MRTSQNQFGPDGFLLHGYDYEHQAWVKDGKYVRCGHPDSMNCGCFGKAWEGYTVNEIEEIGNNEMAGTFSCCVCQSPFTEENPCCCDYAHNLDGSHVDGICKRCHADAHLPGRIYDGKSVAGGTFQRCE
jgi:hypothetical protein